MAASPPPRRRHAALVAGVVLAVAVVLYGAIGFWLAPWLVERYGPEKLAARFGVPVAIGDVRVNPFLLTFTAKDVLVGDARRPFVRASIVYADLSIASLFRRAWTFDDVRVEGLDARLRRAEDGHLQLPAARPGAPPPPLVVRHASLTDGALAYEDATSTPPSSIRLEAVALEVSDIATRGDEGAGRYRLQAQVAGGGELTSDGGIAAAPMTGSGTVSLKGLPLATPWPFLRDRLRLATPQGTLDVAATVRVSKQPDGPLRVAVEDGQVAANGLALAPREGAPYAKLQRFALAGIRFDPDKSAATIESARLDKGGLRVGVSPEGALDWQGIWIARPDAGPGAAWRAEVSRVEADAVDLRYVDQRFERPVALDLQALTGRLALAIASDGAKTVLRASDANLDTARAALAPTQASDSPIVTFAKLHVANGRADTGERVYGADAVRGEGGALTVVRDEQGTLHPLDAMRMRTPADAARDANEPPPWRREIRSIDLRETSLAYVDRTFQPALDYRARLGEATIRTRDDGKALELRLAGAIGETGRLNADGSIDADFSSFAANVKLEAAPLTPLATVLGRIGSLDLKSGAASADAKVAWRRGDANLAVTGTARFDDVVVNETTSREPIVAWKRLDANEVVFGTSPSKLSVREVVLEAPQARVVIAKDHTVNVADAFSKKKDELKEKSKARAHDGPARQANPQAAAPPAFALDVQRVRIRRGVVDYADQTLVLPFATRVRQVQGTIAGISNQPGRRAQVELQGVIPPYGSAKARGAVELFSFRRFTDLRVAFDNVRMPQLSPYTATFAGRTIASGTLWLDVHYSIEQSELRGENEVRLEQFELGERVDAPGTKNLPLDLAVALLKDSKGNIHITVPVRGNVDDPHFAFGSVVRDAFVGLIGKIASAPFRMLASLVGGGRGGNEVDEKPVDFAPGSARLEPEDRERLTRLAKALAERPSLAVVVPPAHAPADADAMKAARLRREVATRLGVKLGPNEEPGPIAYDDPRTQRVLLDIAGTPSDRAAAMKTSAEAEALAERLVKAMPLPDDAVATLARRRAENVVGFLKKQGLGDERVRMGEPREAEAEKSGEITLPLAFEAVRAGG